MGAERSQPMRSVATQAPMCRTYNRSFNMLIVLSILTANLAQVVPSSATLAGTPAWEAVAIESPVACAIDPAGQVVVADSSGEVIALSARDGSVRWRVAAAGDEPFIEPSGIAVEPGGTLLVSDARARRIFRLAKDGGRVGTLDAQSPIAVPGSLAVDPSASGGGRIAIVDRADGGVHIVLPSGQSCGRLPQALFVVDGASCVPTSVAFRPNGELIVAAAEQDRVFVIGFATDTSSARRIAAWGGRGPFPGLFRGPSGVAAAGEWIYVADTFNHRICRQDANGQGRLAYGQHAIRPRDGNGAVHYPSAISVSASVQRGDSAGPLAVACEPFERRVQAFVPGLAAEPADMRLELPNLDGVQSHFGGAAAFGGDRLAMHDPESGTVVILDMLGGQPRHVSNMSASGAKPHETGRIDALWMDARGRRVLLADGGLRRLALWELTERPAQIIFEPFMAKLVKTRPYDRLDSGANCMVVALARGTQGDVLALAQPGPRIVRLDPSLRTVESVPLSLPDTTAQPAGLAVASDGRVAVLLDRPAMLCFFERTATAYEARGVLPLREIRDARSVAALDGGEWLIADSAGDQVAWVGAEGILRRVGTRGVADGQLWLPSAVVGDAEGRAIVVDSGNHRAQRFGAAGAWEMTFSLGRTYTRARTADEVLKVKRPTPAPMGAPNVPQSKGGNQ
jgi:DNA-binding beta-propeller fold protein YncE